MASMGERAGRGREGGKEERVICSGVDKMASINWGEREERGERREREEK